MRSVFPRTVGSTFGIATLQVHVDDIMEHSKEKFALLTKNDIPTPIIWETEDRDLS